jgi:diguanylate cyclase (GGDEF)-like protein
VMHLDLDGFKVVNDSLGHTAGDELLCRLAARMRGALRATDLLARTNGDEFLVLLADIQEDPREIATSVAAKLVRALAVPFEVAGAEFQVGASIGISTAPADATEPGALLAHADAALRRAKTGSRGGWALFARSEQDPMRRLELSAGMRQALTDGQLSLQYQPIHALPDGRLTGLEALLRWHHPDRGWIAPSEFIPVAEETGLIESIGDWVARGVCEQQAAWASRGLLPTISFNVAPRELRRNDFARRMAEHLRATGADPQRIIVELTESTTIQDPAAAEPNLQRLHDLGLALALDDFGTGYSSLARLRSLPIATLKIDRAFLRDVPDDPQAAALLTAVLQIARALGRSTVAEGVETEAQRTFLEREGCEFAQGFLFAPPMPADEVEPLLAAAPALAAR